MLVLWIAGLLTLAFGIGLFFWGILAIWAFVDLFLIPGIVQAHMDDVRRKIGTDMALVSPS